jgi:hypothetical protein
MQRRGGKEWAILEHRADETDWKKSEKSSFMIFARGCIAVGDPISLDVL